MQEKMRVASDLLQGSSNDKIVITTGKFLDKVKMCESHLLKVLGIRQKIPHYLIVTDEDGDKLAEIAARTKLMAGRLNVKKVCFCLFFFFTDINSCNEDHSSCEYLRSAGSRCRFSRGIQRIRSSDRNSKG